MVLSRLISVLKSGLSDPREISMRKNHLVVKKKLTLNTPGQAPLFSSTLGAHGCSLPRPVLPHIFPSTGTHPGVLLPAQAQHSSHTSSSPPNAAAGSTTTTTGSSLSSVVRSPSRHGPCSQSHSGFSCCVNSIWEAVSRAGTVKCVCPCPEKGISDLHFVTIGLKYRRLRNL